MSIVGTVVNFRGLDVRDNCAGTSSSFNIEQSSRNAKEQVPSLTSSKALEMQRNKFLL